MSHKNEQKKIAINTIFLYLRMFVVMGVSLYTSRVVLQKLGVTDFGIYNIVGSVVISFQFVGNALVSAIQRFFSYDIGKTNAELSRIFSLSINLTALIILVLFIVLETIGLYFFTNVIKVPFDRQIASQYVYQLSVLTFLINLLRLPYNALIIAREKMSIYALFSVIDVVLKLLIAFALVYDQSFDRLIFYSFLMLLMTLVTNFCYYIYCKKKLAKDAKYYYFWDKSLFKEFFGFVSWNFVGGVTSAAATEGPNYLINIFLGVGMNAALGVAKQVSTAVYSFSSNFQTAFNPQIVKAYASGDLQYLSSLLFRTSKISFFLLFIISVPLLICNNEVLSLWLVDVPYYANEFCICIIISQLLNAMSSPFWMAAHAIGNIRNYQLTISFFNIVLVPISFLVLKLGIPPMFVIIAQGIINLCILIYRVEYLKRKINFDGKKYYIEVFCKSFILVPLICFPILFTISNGFNDFIKVVIVTLLSLILIPFTYYLLALDKNERTTVSSIIKSKLN